MTLDPLVRKAPFEDVARAWRECPDPRLAFPYMAWAHTHAQRTTAALSQSGMPAADVSLLGAPSSFELVDHPAREALPRLEAAIAARHGVPAERVIVTVGASGGMHACAWHWLGRGARVAVDLPSYEPFRALPRAFGADVRLVERRLDDGWKLDPARVRDALRGGDGPTHVFVANHHNPTGAASTRAESAELARVAGEHGGVLIACELYQEYVDDERAAWTHACAPNTVTISSLTKAYGLGPLRIGWIVLGEGLADQAQLVREKTYLMWVDPPTVTLRAAARAFEHLRELRAPVRANALLQRPLLKRWLESTDGVTACMPEHGVIAFPRIEGVLDTLELAEFLAREHAVDVVPGEFFGLRGHLRIGCAASEDVLRLGLERLTRGLSAWRAR